MLLAGLFAACNKDGEPPPSGELPFPVPEKYSFTRNGEPTIGLTVPAVHIGMCMELPGEMSGYEHATRKSMLDAWMNRNSPFSDPKLNAFDGSIPDFVASSPRPI